MSADEEELRWKIDNVRESISRDWATLASKDLPAEKRKLVREHLNMCTSSLKLLKDMSKQNRVTLPDSKLEAGQPDLFEHPDSGGSSRD
jgi:hypothetical protein